MVNIVICSDAPLQMHIIVDGCEDILFCNMLWNQVCNISLNCSDTLFQCLVFFHNLLQSRIIYQFCNTNSLRVLNFRNPASDIYHHRRKNFYVTCLCLNPERRNCSILNLICQITVNSCACLCNYFSGRRIQYILCQNLSVDTVL